MNLQLTLTSCDLLSLSKIFPHNLPQQVSNWAILVYPEPPCDRGTWACAPRDMTPSPASCASRSRVAYKQAGHRLGQRMDVGSSECPVPPWLCSRSSACPISLKFQRLLLLTSPHHGPQITSLIRITRFSQPSSLLPFRVVSQRSGMSEPYHLSPMAWDSLSKSKELHRRFQNVLGCFLLTFMYPHLWTW